MSVIIYRELAQNMPPETQQWLEDRNQLIVVEDKQGNLHYIVENDTPRPSEVTEAIVGSKDRAGCTLGFGVYDDAGNRIGMYRSIDRAEAAAAKAVTVTLDSDEGVEWDSIDASSH